MRVTLICGCLRQRRYWEAVGRLENRSGRGRIGYGNSDRTIACSVGAVAGLAAGNGKALRTVSLGDRDRREMVCGAVAVLGPTPAKVQVDAKFVVQPILIAVVVDARAWLLIGCAD